MKIKLLKAHQGRPVTLVNMSGVTMYGKIAKVVKGRATVEGIYVEGGAAPDNGSYATTIRREDKRFTHIEIH